MAQFFTHPARPAGMDRRPLRVYVVDAAKLSYYALRVFFEGEPWLELLGGLPPGPLTLYEIQAAEPNVIVADLTMPSRERTQFLHDLCTVAPRAYIVLTSRSREELGYPGLPDGVDEFIARSDIVPDLLNSLKRLAGHT
jgi:DNA-binding NarL/FixJ family response regulator